MSDYQKQVDQWLSQVKDETKAEVVRDVLNWVDSEQDLRDRYAKDEHLNNIPLRYWDGLSQYISLGIKGLTLSQRVVILKSIVREELER